MDFIFSMTGIVAPGALAFALLTAVTWSSVRVAWIRKIITGEPIMLLYLGSFLPTALLRARVTEDEVYAAIRSAGLEALDEIKTVVLETDGSFSVVRKGDGSGFRVSNERASLEGYLDSGAVCF